MPYLVPLVSAMTSEVWVAPTSWKPLQQPFSSAIGVALELGIPDETIQRGFSAFGGVKRRFTHVGEVAMEDGKAEDAAATMLLLGNMGMQAGEERNLIGSLVGTAIGGRPARKPSRAACAGSPGTMP